MLLGETLLTRGLPLTSMESGATLCVSPYLLQNVGGENTSNSLSKMSRELGCTEALIFLVEGLILLGNGETWVQQAGFPLGIIYLNRNGERGG